MITFRWIEISPLLILMLQFTVFSAAETKHVSFFTIRVGNEVTLPCENVNNSQRGCPSWIFRGLTSKDTKQLTSNGQIGEKAKDKSDRLSVAANCALVIENITAEDVGQYACIDITSGELQRQGLTFTVYLSVINMTENENNDKAIFNCSVVEYDQCRHRVEWLYESNQKTPSDTGTPRACSAATVIFRTSHVNQMSTFYESLSCKVTDQQTKKEQLFPFSPQSSGEKTGLSHLLRNILLSVALAALLISAVIVNIWIKTKGNKTKMEENAVRNEGTENCENTGNPPTSVRPH